MFGRHQSAVRSSRLRWKSRSWLEEVYDLLHASFAYQNQMIGVTVETFIDGACSRRSSMDPDACFTGYMQYI